MMHRWLVFYIIISSIAGLGLFFIPYPETQVNYDSEGGENWWGSDMAFEFPWRSYNQEIFLNFSLISGSVSIRILEGKDLWPYYSDAPFIPFWEILNTTGFITTLEISPPIIGYLFIVFKPQNYSNTYYNLNSEIKVSYLRYASSYGFVFLGIAVILISYYGFIKHKMKSKY